MRFATRILIGVAAATTVAVAAPAAASATTATAASAASSSYDSWGSYHSRDGNAKAHGSVVVHQKKYKEWYWKTFWVKKKVCWEKNGDLKCKWVPKKVKKHVWEWKHQEFFTVHANLHNKKWWGKNDCAWATFKIVDSDGSTHFERYKNCHKFPKHFSFSGKDVERVSVNVSRGNEWSPKGWHSGWENVYHAAP